MRISSVPYLRRVYLGGDQWLHRILASDLLVGSSFRQVQIEREGFHHRKRKRSKLVVVGNQQRTSLSPTFVPASFD
jgi:hypothetical protein